jgi:glutaredoxin 3
MTNCYHCIQTKNLMSSLNINAKIIELDQMKNGLGAGDDSIAMNLYRMTGQRTVPNVFVQKQHLGGNDETQAAARSGRLQQMLNI